MPSPKPWVAVTATEDLPVSMNPVEAVLRGVAPVKTVPLPYSKLGLEEESRFADMFQGAVGMLVRAGYITPTLLDQLPVLVACSILSMDSGGPIKTTIFLCWIRFFGTAVSSTVQVPIT